MLTESEVQRSFRNLFKTKDVPSDTFDKAEALLDEHQRGGGRHGQILWSLLVLSRWAEQFLSPPRSISASAHQIVA